MLAKWLQQETTASVELALPMIPKLQVIFPELLVITFYSYFAGTMKGLSLVIVVVCLCSGVLRLVLQTRETEVLCGFLLPIPSVLSLPFSYVYVCVCVCVVCVCMFVCYVCTCVCRVCT